MPIAVGKLSKIFRGSTPPDPPENFLYLNLLQICSAKKKYAKRNVENLLSPPKKIFWIHPRNENFERAYIRLFPGLKI